MNGKFWNKKKVIVTGGTGFLGKHLIPKLESLKADVFIPTHKDFDLRKEDDVDRLFKSFKPEIFIHMAVHDGGIGYMKIHPGNIFFDNVMMNTLVLEKSRQYKIDKFIGIGTVCSYPKVTPVPFKEENLWDGYPEETTAPYGLAKKMMLVQTQVYRQQYDFNGVHLLLANMYGPHDDFNKKTSHVIPSLINRFTEAVEKNKKEVIVWGSGKASREFLYVDDAAMSIILASEKYNKSDPVNVGSGFEIKIKDLVELIADQIGFNGDIVWDKNKPDGQQKRCLDISRAKKEFSFKAKIDFKKGIKKTVDWYNSQKSLEKIE